VGGGRSGRGRRRAGGCSVPGLMAHARRTVRTATAADAPTKTPGGPGRWAGHRRRYTPWRCCGRPPTCSGSGWPACWRRPAAAAGRPAADRSPDALTGALLALTDLPEMARVGSCGAPACRRDPGNCTHDLSGRPGSAPGPPTATARPHLWTATCARHAGRRCRFPWLPPPGLAARRRTRPTTGPIHSDRTSAAKPDRLLHHRPPRQTPGPRWRHEGLTPDGHPSPSPPPYRLVRRHHARRPSDPRRGGQGGTLAARQGPTVRGLENGAAQTGPSVSLAEAAWDCPARALRHYDPAGAVPARRLWVRHERLPLVRRRSGCRGAADRGDWGGPVVGVPLDDVAEWPGRGGRPLTFVRSRSPGPPAADGKLD
jgi:hypothetical protein